MYQQSSYEYTSTTTSYNSDDNVVRTSSTHIQSESQTLIVNAVGANFLKDGQKIGTQDPFMRFGLNLEDKKSFQKTYTAKNGGKTPSWNQSFTLSLSGEQHLYIEVLDEETTSSALIGFAAIPINQVVYAQGASLNGLFEVYDVKSNVVGEVNLVLQAKGFENSSNEQPQSNPIRGTSIVHEEHQKQCKSMRTKEHATEAGVAVLGGALAIGAGLLGKKLFDDHKKEEQEQHDRDEEEERRRQEFSQREEELKRREEEFGRRESQEKAEHRDEEEHKAKARCDDDEDNKKKSKSCDDSKKKSCDDKKKSKSCDDKKKKKKDCDRKKKKDCSDDDSSSGSSDSGSSDSGSDSDDDDKKKKKGHGKKKGSCSSDDWDPVGTYAAGDRVEYKGRTYVCLQGHTSNPTWEPTVAHSLWRTE
ncbi:hypothetical protein [Absidia glauca]|uniref:C2 domain-containing protein n=1 Tax=Absidia glauca TaxID=4829 RepID=A0A163JK92_ABSGL|nr:hypothetical protein [Absidia glauca]